MNCRDCQKNLAVFWDGELPQEDARAMADHLDSCPSCRNKLKELENLKNTLVSMPTPDSPDGMEFRIMARASEEFFDTPGNSFSFLGVTFCPARWLGPAITTTAMVCGLFIGGMLGWSSHLVGFSPSNSAQFSGPRESRLAASMSAVPEGSIEAAVLAMLDNGEVR